MTSPTPPGPTPESVCPHCDLGIIGHCTCPTIARPLSADDRRAAELYETKLYYGEIE